mgnify:FL=1
MPQSTSCASLQFADDASLSVCDHSLDTVKDKLVNGFCDIREFCNNKELTLNTNKTQFLIVKAASKRLPEPVTLTLDGVDITALTAVKLLGITVDRHLTFAEHVRNTVTKCNGLLGVLHRAAPCLSRELLRLAYIALVQSQLEYCGGLLLTVAKTHLT